MSKMLKESKRHQRPNRPALSNAVIRVDVNEIFTECHFSPVVIPGRDDVAFKMPAIRRRITRIGLGKSGWLASDRERYSTNQTAQEPCI
jgi:hypothetical protein